MTTRFDVLVIGTGTAGSAAAFACAKTGLNVAICDNLPFGGTCALRGCDPKKVLVAAEETVDLFHRMQKAGAVAGSGSIDWSGLMKFKRSFTDPVPANRERSYEESKIATFHGAAAFTSRDSVRIAGQDISAEHFVVAAGAEPARLDFPGEEHLLGSTQFLELETLPARVAFVGGGFISFEFAHICARAGVKATIIHRGERPLEKFDYILVQKLSDVTRSLGVDLILGATVSSVERSEHGFTVTANGQSFSADLVVHGAGRVAAISSLDLQTGGIEATEKGIEVNEYLQSVSNPSVYAAGDVAASGGLPLTPVADYLGSVAATNIIGGNSKPVSFSDVPSIVFTEPALGAVGMTQAQADSKGIAYKLREGDSSQWYSNRRVNETTAFYRVLVDGESQRILGAHVLGPGTEELINLFAAFMQFNATAPQIQNAILAYPTYGSDISFMVGDA